MKTTIVKSSIDKRGEIMKNKSVSQSILTGLFVVLVLAVSNSIVRAQGSPPTTSWIGGTGDWFTPGNWSGVLPNPLVDAYINNGGEALIYSGGDAMAISLTLGDNQGDAGSVIIADASSVLQVGNIYIGNRGSGNLKIANTGHNGGITSRYAYVAAGANPIKPASNGTVTVEGNLTIWDIFDDPPLSFGAGLFIGCTADSNGAGGTALVDVEYPAYISVHNHDGGFAVTVGHSGTLTGSGTLEMVGSSGTPTPTPSSITAKVFGTLAPTGLLTIDGNLDLTSLTNTSNTVCHVTPQANDEVYVSQLSGGGHAHLGGRVTVIMTGSFTAGMSFPLLSAQGGLDETSFLYTSIIYNSNPWDPCLDRVITYDANTVYLEIHDCGGG
jgi:T5SS/PEP-CTERM-associated repeat protein